jgi:hypothetical protein
MVEAADAAERLFMVSQNRRYMPELIAFRDTVARLGRLSELTCDFFIAHRERAAEFLFAFPQPLLLDMAIHLFDGARAITGADPLSVFCDAYNPPYSWYDGPASAHAIFRMSGGLRFAFSGNWAADGFETSWTGSWRAVGEHGTAVWEGDGALPRVEPGPGAAVAASVPILIPESEIRFKGLAASLAEFVSALRTGTTPQGEAHDNIQSLAMCHAAVASAELGAPVPVTAFTSARAWASTPPERRYGRPAPGTSTVVVSSTASRAAARACSSKSGAAHATSVRPSSPPSPHANTPSPPASPAPRRPPRRRDPPHRAGHGVGRPDVLLGVQGDAVRGELERGEHEARDRARAPAGARPTSAGPTGSRPRRRRTR